MAELIDFASADAKEVLRKLYRIYEAVTKIADECEDDGNDVTFDGLLFDDLCAALDDFEGHTPEAVVDQPLAFEHLVAAVTQDYSGIAA